MFKVFNQLEGESPRTIEIYDRVLGALVDPGAGLGPDVSIGHAAGLELREYVASRFERTPNGEVPLPLRTTRK